MTVTVTVTVTVAVGQNIGPLARSFTMEESSEGGLCWSLPVRINDQDRDCDRDHHAIGKFSCLVP